MERHLGRNSSRALAAILVAAALGWSADGLLGRSVTTDDGISLLSAAAIREHGYPLLPSHLIYDRAYLAHYALAASTAVFGTNDAGIALPSLLAGLGTLVLVFQLGRRVLGSDAAGLVACGLVAVSPDQVLYAASPRMYGLLTFFCTWSVLAGWRGFVEGERRQHALAVVATALGLQCERGAGALIPAAAMALLFVESGPLRQRLRAIARRVRPVGSAEWAALALLAASVALVFVHPRHALHPIIVEAGNPVRFLDFSLAPERYFWHLLHVDGMLPGTLWLAGVGGVAIFRDDARARRFLPVLFGTAFLSIVALLVHNGHRMVLFLLPLYALLVAHGGLTLARALRDRVSLAPVVRSAGVAAVTYGACLGVAGLVPERLAWAYPTTYVAPDRSREGHPDIERELLALRTKLRPDDLVLTSNPWVSHHYLGKTDGILRQRVTESGLFKTFKLRRNEYFGARIYDKWSRIDALLATLLPGQRAWMVAERKSDVFWSPVFLAEFERRFPRANDNERLRIYTFVAPPVAVAVP